MQSRKLDLPSAIPKTPATTGNPKRLKLTLAQNLKLLQYYLQSASIFGQSKKI